MTAPATVDDGAQRAETDGPRAPRPTGSRAWLLVSALAPVVAFAPAVVGRRLIAPGDGHTFYLPMQSTVADTWRSGSFPGWDRGTFAGSPLFSLHQSAALHPTILFRLLLPPVPAHNATVLSALMVAGLGAHLLAHRFTGDHLASAVAGCAFALCGFQFAHLGHVAIIATTAWLPWALWAADRLMEERSLRRMAAGAAVVAIAALSGHGQMLTYLLVATVVYALVIGARRRAGHVVAVVAMTVAGLAVAAVQLVPVVMGLQGSSRSSLSQAEATAFSQDPKGLLVLVSPFLYGNARPDGPVRSLYAGHWTLTELSGYVGAAALVLAVAGAPAWRRDRRVAALAVIAIGSTLVALGGSTPLGTVVHALPVLGQMRSWARYTVGLQLAVAVLAAVGVAGVRAGRTTVRPVGLTLATVVVGVAVGTAPGLGSIRVRGAELVWAVGAPVAAALIAVALIGVSRRYPGALAALVLLVALDPVLSFGWWFRWRSASPSPTEAVAQLDGRTASPWGHVPDQPGGIDRYLWAGSALAALPYGPRMASARGDLSVTGNDPLAPADYLEVTGTNYLGDLVVPSRLLGPRSHLLDLLRVTVVARDTGDRVQRTVRRPALPEAFVVGAIRRETSARAMAAAIGSAPLDPGGEGIVEVGCHRCPRGRAGRAGTARATHWGRSSAAVTIAADRPGLLVVSQAWSPGWSATVDGRPAPVVRVDGVVQGVPVPAGRSRVELRYRPPGLIAGGATSALAVAGIGAALAVDAGRRRGRQRRQKGNRSRRWISDGGSGHAAHTG